jgi:high-affinity iron transporter
MGHAIVGFVVVLAATRAVAAEPAPAARLYAERCSGCHGDDGRGDGPAAEALVPRPRNFRAPGFWKDRTLEQTVAAVKKGKVGTMMPPFDGVLTEAEIEAVARFVRGFAEPPVR